MLIEKYYFLIANDFTGYLNTDNFAFGMFKIHKS